MSEWILNILVNKKNINLKITGRTLKSAIRSWGKKQPEGTEIGCGQLIRLKEDRVYKYWSGQEFMRCFD